MAAKLLGPDEPTISALSLRRVCLAWAAGVFSKTCGGKSRVRVGKYRKVQELALAGPGPRANIWSHLSRVQNSTICKGTGVPALRRKRNLTPLAARASSDVKNNWNKCTNGKKRNRHPSVANAQLTGQDT